MGASQKTPEPEEGTSAEVAWSRYTGHASELFRGGCWNGRFATSRNQRAKVFSMVTMGRKRRFFMESGKGVNPKST